MSEKGLYKKYSVVENKEVSASKNCSKCGQDVEVSAKTWAGARIKLSLAFSAHNLVCRGAGR